VLGFLYEASGAAARAHLAAGEATVRAAAARWRIPVEILDHDPADWPAWSAAARGAMHRLVGR
jgi:hypothetical protein